jgi:hypothetical protein
VRAKFRKLSLCLSIVFEETALVLCIKLYELSKPRIFHQTAVSLCSANVSKRGRRKKERELTKDQEIFISVGREKIDEV